MPVEICSPWYYAWAPRLLPANTDPPILVVCASLIHEKLQCLLLDQVNLDVIPA